MKKLNISRIIFLTSCAIMIFLYGVVSSRLDWAPYPLIEGVKDSIKDVYQDRHALLNLDPAPFLQPARHVGNGVTVNQVEENNVGWGDELILLSSFYDRSNELQLIRRDGTVVARWPVKYTELFPDTGHMYDPPLSDWNVDLHGSLILPDGSVVFNFEYGGMVSLDRCGTVNWTVERATHHSTEQADDGSFWVPGRRHHPAGSPSPFPPYKTPYAEDTVINVSSDGEILHELSVPQMLYDAGMEAVLTSTGEAIYSDHPWDRELVHVNKVTPLPAAIADDFPLFDAGDLAVSMRKLNLLIVVDPQDGRVKWWHIGPWLRQHDPEFKAGGTIVLFNNNTYISEPDANTHSQIMEIDPITNDARVLYGNATDQKMLSIIRGKVQANEDGRLLITEFEAGRAFEVDAAGNVIWEYINRYDADRVAEITEARSYPASYFTVDDWTCPSRAQND
jgi:hypothetical protein